MKRILELAATLALALCLTATVFASFDSHPNITTPTALVKK